MIHAYKKTGRPFKSQLNIKSEVNFEVNIKQRPKNKDQYDATIRDSGTK